MKRVTKSTLKVVQAFVENVDQELYGRQLVEFTGLKSGTVHPILSRLEGMGWLVSKWEMHHEPGRPPRRMYEMTEFGHLEAAELLSQRSAPARRSGATIARPKGATS